MDRPDSPVLITDYVDRVNGSRGAVCVRDQHDALERALANCLWAFSELASSAGQSQRSVRLRTAAELLLRDGPLSPPIASQEPAGQVTPSGRGAPLSRRKTCALTRREQQVAGLIAEGFTNRQIADELRISERTADTHVQNILNRLGLVSRAQVAAWVVEFSQRGAR